MQSTKKSFTFLNVLEISPFCWSKWKYRWLLEILEIQCLTIGAHLSEFIWHHKVSVTKNNLVSIRRIPTKKFKTFLLPECFGNPSSLFIKIKTQQITRNIPWNFCVWWTMRTRHEQLCIEKPIERLIYLPNFKSNQK